MFSGPTHGVGSAGNSTTLNKNTTFCVIYVNLFERDSGPTHGVGALGILPLPTKAPFCMSYMIPALGPMHGVGGVGNSTPLNQNTPFCVIYVNVFEVDT